ncbi:kynurenine 3-monooxygenase [Pseudohyphozyma bogoriensis]|nr:kynurenine 3-monooxygenase [Pseudohyphozyma bogoriensis]
MSTPSTSAASSSTPRQPTNVCIIGAGLVGTLCASMLSARGWSVTLYESRPDPRLTPAASRARSINLALSPRGIEALRSVSESLVQDVLKEVVPMRGRMLHHSVRNGQGSAGVRQEGQDYGVFQDGECINSVSRTQLGVMLLDHLKGDERVKVGFETKLVEMDLRMDEGVSLLLRTRDGERTEKFDWVIGGDGAYSQVRKQMMRGGLTRFNFSQSYARHCYLELSIPAGPDNTFSIEPNYLHIWPRGEFMLIALPNLDKSFTLTLFAPKSHFDELTASSDAFEGAASKTGQHPIVKLFSTEFPDALELMGEKELLKSWEENPKDGLITVECAPYHYLDKVLLIGDAGHAMPCIPQGQGMNCGFEDVRVLSTILDHFSASPSPPPTTPSPLPYSSTSSLPPLNQPLSSTTIALQSALSTYTTLRAPSLKAIQDLAAQNYREMAHSVLSPLYIFRLSLDRALSRLFDIFGTKEGGGRGGKWESLYRMVTFRYGLSYEEVLRRRAWQGWVLECVVKGVVGAVVLPGAVWGYSYARSAGLVSGRGLWGR